MRILLTNDDGYDAPGIAALYRALTALPEVTDVLVVAPLEAQSAMSHAITLHRPLTAARRTKDGAGQPMPGYAVDGRPADCVKLALASLAEHPIDLVVSGMNAGANVGLNVLYSGTVGAAREAAFSGLPAVAISLYLNNREDLAWDRAAGYGVEAMQHTLGGTDDQGRPAIDMEPGTVININVPVLDDGRVPKGITAAELYLHHNAGTFDPVPGDVEQGETKRFMAGGTLAYDNLEPGCDVERMFDGWIVVTPLHFDLTHRDEIDRLRRVFEAMPSS